MNLRCRGLVLNNMDTIALVAFLSSNIITLSLCYVLVYKESSSKKERASLIDRIMAKSFIEYTNAEMSKIEASKPEKEIEPPKVRI
jgi:hypothetical protein